MPRRPPKKWWYHSIRVIKKHFPDIDDPDRFAGWLWYHHLKPGTKKAILTQAEIETGYKMYRKKKHAKKRIARKTRKHGSRRGRARMSGSGRGKRARKNTRTMKRRARAHRPARINKKKKHGKKTIFRKGRAKGMAKHRKHKMHGLEGRGRQLVIMGKKHHKRDGKRRGFLMGDPGIMGRMGNNALNVMAGVAGGVGGAFVTNMIPASTKVKPYIPIVGGILLASLVNIPALKFAGLGLGILGGLSLVKQVMPTGFQLAGETTIVIPGPEQQRQLGDPIQLGDPVDIQAPAGLGWATQNDT